MKKRTQYLHVILILSLLAAIVSGHIYFSFEFPLKEKFIHYHLALKSFHEHHPITTPFLFMGAYVLYALFSLPGIFVFSVLAGFLFIQPFSTLYVTVAATIGASCAFLVARYTFGKASCHSSNFLFLSRLEKGLQKNPVNYLLILRLIPLFPFWGINLASAYFGVSFRTFVWTTFIGMIPSVFIYTQAGNSFQDLIQSPDPFNPMHYLNWQGILGLMSLIILLFLPLIIKSNKIDHKKVINSAKEQKQD